MGETRSSLQSWSLTLSATEAPQARRGAILARASRL